MVDNPLLSYLDIQLPRFLPPGLTFEEARHLGPWLIKQDFLKPIQNYSRDNIFQGWAVHIPMDAPILGDPNKEGLVVKDAHLEEPIPPN